VFQIWWNESDNIPDVYIPFIEANKRILQQFEYELYTRTKLLKFLDQNQDCKEKYKKLRFSEYYFQSDFLRMCLLYKLKEAVYIDLDLLLEDSFPELIRRSFEEFSGKFVLPQNLHYYFLKTENNSKLLEFLLDRYTKLVDAKYDNSVFLPVLTKEFLKEIVMLNNKTLDKYFRHYCVRHETKSV